MSISEAEASELINALEIATEGNWPQFARSIKEREIDIPTLRAGWKKLEQKAGYCGMVPDEGDFDW